MTKENPQILGTFVFEEIGNKCYKMLVVEEVECEQTDGWQPMSTAPKGVPILLHLKWGNGDCICVGSINIDYPHVFDLIGFLGSEGAYEDIELATHWMPLPTPPKP